MFNYGLFFLLLSIIGFLGMTAGPALLAFLFYFPTRFLASSPRSVKTQQGNGVEFLIPVHNQAQDLEETLISLSQLPANFKMTVGANACSDHTIAVAEKYKARVIVRERPGKWDMLHDLTASAKEEWLILMDAGTLVEKDFLERLNLESVPSDVLGLAPRYFPKKLGIIQKAIWIFESLLKLLENFSGGPISVHGACVVYRREKLLKVFASLSHWQGKDISWANDDVVIPLWLRFQNPKEKILYRFDICLDDWDIHKAPASKARRKRLIQGNIQWMTTLWPGLLKANFPLFVLSSRRLFRVAWAWWPVLFYLGILLIVGSSAFKWAILFLLISSLFFIITFIRKNEIAAAFIYSLLFFRWKNQLRWK
jgi:cellulose synthase/poly-beta-1,6-N-acetylglucosamine synthase-like glycosyltransferase